MVDGLAPIRVGLVKNVDGGLSPSPSENSFRVLSADPAIIIVQDFFLKTLRNPAWRLLERARFKRTHVLVKLTWSYEEEILVRRLARHMSRWTSGARRYHVLANTEAERDLFKSYGIAATHVNHNSYINENVFHPLGSEKKYDAVYDAAFAPFKRHELAADVQNLALISYLKRAIPRFRAAEIAQLVSHATFLNDPLSGPQSWLSATQVNTFLNQARVGLCLSAVEGAMVASTQYLLAGLPVVTTKNRGGRDEFFHEDYVRWVDDDPRAVAAAVQELAAANIDPNMIRNRTLAVMSRNRQAFVDLLNGFVGEKYPGRKWASEWPSESGQFLISE